MAGLVGMGTMTFGSAGLTYKAEDGITESGPTGVAVECTGDGDTSDKMAAGDVVNHGTVSAVVIADDTVNVEDLVNTVDSLAITYPLGTHTTAKSKTGQAICTSAARTSAKNTLNTYAVEFTWSDKPVIVDAT